MSASGGCTWPTAWDGGWPNREAAATGSFKAAPQMDTKTAVPGLESQWKEG